jgi:hypothetical protein
LIIKERKKNIRNCQIKVRKLLMVVGQVLETVSDVLARLEALKPSKPSPVKPGQAQAVRRLGEGSEPGLNSSKA